YVRRQSRESPLHNLLTTHTSTHSNAVVAVHSRRVRQNYLITLAQAVDDLDGANRIAPQRYGGAKSLLSVRAQAKQSNGLLSLPKGGTAHVQDVFQALQLDRSINTQIRSRARWY